MPPRRKASGLTDEEVGRLRDQLAEGRRPRVALSGPQFEAGASGSVIRIGDPATDGADFLTVRVKVNGVTDELAFAPSELSTGRPKAKAAAAKPARTSAARGRQGAASSASAPSGAGSAGTASSGTAPSGAASTGTASSGTASSVAVSAATAPTGTAAAATGPSGTASSAPSRTAAARKATRPTPATQPSPPKATSSTPAASQAATGGSAGRRRKTPAAPTVSVTIRSSGAAWSVTANRGARTILKNAPITPGVVTALADLLGQPGVSEAVAEINEAARQQAQQRAEQLRAELSDLEAVLATHRSPR